MIASNNKWREVQELAIDAADLGPGDDREAAIMQPFMPGSYAAIVRGKKRR